MSGSGGAVGDFQAPLNRDQIKQILPHRDPFLFLDFITELTPGESAVGKKIVLPDEYYFEGHFPGRPIMPGVLIIEAMAQTGAVAALTPLENQGKLVFFAGVDGVRWKKQVIPPAVLYFRVNLIRLRGSVGKATAEAFAIPTGRSETEWYNKGNLACKGELTFAIADQEK